MVLNHKFDRVVRSYFVNCICTSWGGIYAHLGLFPSERKVKAKRWIRVEYIDISKAWCFFDGATQVRIGCGGIGGTLHLSDSLSYNVSAGIECASNIKSELAATKLILK